MFIQLQKQFRMVETEVVKSLCLDLTEYNINYTKKKKKKKKRTNRQKSDRT